MNGPPPEYQPTRFAVPAATDVAEPDCWLILAATPVHLMYALYLDGFESIPLRVPRKSCLDSGRSWGNKGLDHLRIPGGDPTIYGIGCTIRA